MQIEQQIKKLKRKKKKSQQPIYSYNISIIMFVYPKSKNQKIQNPYYSLGIFAPLD